MTTLVVIDPGLSSGICVGEYSDTEPFRPTHAFQIEGGLTGFFDSFDRISEIEFNQFELWIGKYGSDNLHRVDMEDEDSVRFVCEKFTPRQSLTLKSAEPLRIEGALVQMGIVPDYVQGGKNPQWQHPPAQYFCGGQTLSEKKKRSREFLKKHGLHLTGKMVGCKDADDAISARLHAFAYMRRIKHMPTLRHYFGEETE